MFGMSRVFIIFSVVFGDAFGIFVSEKRLERGDFCQLENGKPGKCALIYDCVSAMQDLLKGLKPKICGFDDITPIVCCNQLLLKQNKAEEKCYEYHLHPFVLRFGKKINETDVINEKQNKTVSESTRIKRNINNSTGEYVNKIQIGYKFPYEEDSDHEIPAPAVGGELTELSEFPHMAALGYGNETHKKWLCGGTLISDEYVLTAAHCLDSTHGPVRYVRLGGLNLYSRIVEASIQDFLVTKRIPHPAYKPPQKYHDIALIKLDKLAEMNDYVKPACLNTHHEITETVLTATGWGLTEPFGNPSDHLVKVDLDVYEEDECERMYGPERLLKKGYDNEGMICAGGRTKEKGTCNGDSGGPLQAYSKEINGYHTIYGVTSFGKVCAVVNTSGVYTRVSRYVPWIENIVWPDHL